MIPRTTYSVRTQLPQGPTNARLEAIPSRNFKAHQVLPQNNLLRAVLMANHPGIDSSPKEILALRQQLSNYLVLNNQALRNTRFDREYGLENLNDYLLSQEILDRVPEKILLPLLAQALGRDIFVLQSSGTNTYQQINFLPAEDMKLPTGAVNTTPPLFLLKNASGHLYQHLQPNTPTNINTRLETSSANRVQDNDLARGQTIGQVQQDNESNISEFPQLKRDMRQLSLSGRLSKTDKHLAFTFLESETPINLHSLLLSSNKIGAIEALTPNINEILRAKGHPEVSSDDVIHFFHAIAKNSTNNVGLNRDQLLIPYLNLISYNKMASLEKGSGHQRHQQPSIFPNQIQSMFTDDIDLDTLGYKRKPQIRFDVNTTEHQLPFEDDENQAYSESERPPTLTENRITMSQDIYAFKKEIEDNIENYFGQMHNSGRDVETDQELAIDKIISEELLGKKADRDLRQSKISPNKPKAKADKSKPNLHPLRHLMMASVKNEKLPFISALAQIIEKQLSSSAIDSERIIQFLERLAEKTVGRREGESLESLFTKYLNGGFFRPHTTSIGRAEEEENNL